MKKVPQVIGATLILTENCNLNCKYCFERVEKRNPENQMTLETAKKAIDFLVNSAKLTKEKTIYIDYFGGEPLLNLETLRLSFDYASSLCENNDLKLICRIITNGTVYNDEYEQFLIHWYNTLGYIDVQLSIDGLPESHDLNRLTINNQPTSKIVEDVASKYFTLIHNNKMENAKLSAHGVLNQQTLPNLYNNYLYLNKMGFKTISFVPVQEVEWTDNDVEIFKSQSKLIADNIFDLCQSFNNSDFYFNYKTLSQCRGKLPSEPCPIGKFKVAISTNGDIHPCHYTYFNDKTLKIGDVNNGIDDAKRQFFLDYGFENVFGDKPCTECTNTSCYVCVAANYVHNGNFLVGFPNYCKLVRAEDEVRRELADKLEQIGLIKSPFVKTTQQPIKQADQKQVNGQTTNSNKSNNLKIDDSKNNNDNISVETFNKILTLLSSYSQDAVLKMNTTKDIDEKLNFIIDAIGDLTQTLSLYITLVEKNKKKGV